MTADPTIEPLAEDALLLRFGDRIDPDITARVLACAGALRAAGLPGVIDIAPAYATLLVRFDPSAPLDSQGSRLSDRIATSLRLAIDDGAAAVACPQDPRPPAVPEPSRGFAMQSARPAQPPRAVDVPVCYGGDHGPDVDAVAAYAHISRDEVIARHLAGGYTVAMLGFAPGFPYLLGLDPALHVSRRDDPRIRVPAGSVAIGGAQTGIYPIELPGGWHLLGCTPLVLFDARRDPPCLLAPGDRVRFRAIDEATFARLAGGRA